MEAPLCFLTSLSHAGNGQPSTLTHNRHAHPLHNWILDPRKSALSLAGSPHPRGPDRNFPRINISPTEGRGDAVQTTDSFASACVIFKKVGTLKNTPVFKSNSKNVFYHISSHISVQKKKGKTKCHWHIGFAQSCWYQDSAGCLQTFFFEQKTARDLSENVGYHWLCTLLVCVCVCSFKSASFSEIPFSGVRKGILCLSAVAGKRT